MSTSARPPETDVLLVVDLQDDFCPGGALPVPDGDQVVAPINRLMAAFEHFVVTQDWHPRNHSSFASAHPGSSDDARRRLQAIGAPVVNAAALRSIRVST